MSSSCIFCASPTFSEVNVKSEEIVTPADDQSPPQVPSHQDDKAPIPEFEGDSAIQGNLGSFFILKKIFKLSNETLSLFLSIFNGQPENWITTCHSCGTSVHQFFQTLKQISTLERQLTKVEIDLKGKIEDSKNISGNPVWTQIRKEVLSNVVKVNNIDTGIDVDSGLTPAFQVHSEHLKEERDNGDNSSPSPPPEASSSSLFLDPLDDNPPVFEELELSPTRKRRAVNHLQHPNKTRYFSNCRIFKMGKKSLRGCLQCPYYSNNPKHFEAHLKLHEEGAPHTICEGCGHYLRPMGMGIHLPRCPSKTPKTFDISGNKNVDNSNPHYTAFTRGHSRHYLCRNCPFETPKVSRVLEHAKVHGEGARAEVCVECGWFVLEAKMEHHRQLRHVRHRYRNDYNISREGYTISVSGDSRYYKCNQCPFQTRNSLAPILNHLKLHEEGSEASACEQCHIYVLPIRLKQHRAVHHHDKEMSILPD